MPHMRQEADRAHTAQGTVIWETKVWAAHVTKPMRALGKRAKPPEAIQGSLIQKEAILSHIRG